LYKVILYSTSQGNVPIEKYLENLQEKGKQKDLININHYIKELKHHGFGLNQRMSNAYKEIDANNKIYELRPKKYRIFFIFIKGEDMFVLLHAFTKKSRKTPKKEIKRAIREANDYRERREDG